MQFKTQGTAQAAAEVEAMNSRIGSSMKVTQRNAAEMLLQQQLAQERAVEQALLSHGITPIPGSSKLTARQLGSLGLTEAELGSLGLGRTASGITRAGEQMGWGTRSAIEKL